MAAGGLPKNYIVVSSLEHLGMLAKDIATTKRFAFDVESHGLDPWRDEIYCVSFFTNNTGYLVNFAHPLLPISSKDTFAQVIGGYFSDPRVSVRGFNYQFDAHMVEEQLGIRCEGVQWDAEVGQWFVDENVRPKALKPLAALYLGYDTGGTYSEQFGRSAWIVIDPLVASFYAIKDAELHEKLCAYQESVLDAKNLANMADEMAGISRILFPTEREGFPVDHAKHAEVTTTLESEISDLVSQMTEMVGEVDWNNPDAVAGLLFDRLRMPRFKGNSTDKATLESLESRHPIIPLIIEYRSITKLKGSYCDNLAAHLKPDGKLHPIIRAIGTVTHRPSSSDPNMLNVPGKGRGKVVRKLYEAPPGFYIVSKDFSGQELRLQAVLSGDANLAKVVDYYYDYLASVAYGGSPADYSKHGNNSDKRDIAKIVALARNYGAQPPKIAGLFGWALSKAQEFEKQLKARFPQHARWVEKQEKMAEKLGYTEDILGRRRHLPLNDPQLETWQRNALKRQASNAPVQTSAKSQTLRAMLRCEEHFRKRGYKSKVKFNIYDEIIFWFDIEEFWTTTISAEASYIMSHALDDLTKMPFPTTTELYPFHWGETLETDEEIEALRCTTTLSS